MQLIHFKKSNSYPLRDDARNGSLLPSSIKHDLVDGLKTHFSAAWKSCTFALFSQTANMMPIKIQLMLKKTQCNTYAYLCHIWIGIEINAHQKLASRPAYQPICCPHSKST